MSRFALNPNATLMHSPKSEEGACDTDVRLPSRRCEWRHLLQQARGGRHALHTCTSSGYHGRPGPRRGMSHALPTPPHSTPSTQVQTMSDGTAKAHKAIGRAGRGSMLIL